MELRDYQKEGVARLIEILRMRGCAYLADDMGLGKTAQAIDAVRKTSGLTMPTALVICPASLRLNWQREWLQWSGYQPFAVLKLSDIKNATFNCRVAIISYDMALKASEDLEFMERTWDFLILDEAHYVKNPKAKRTRVCLKKFWNQATYRLALSGTPLPNGVIDGYTLFNRMAPEAFPDYFKFGFRFTQAKRNWFTGHWEFKGGKNLQELKRIVRSTFMVRRTKKAVLTELPPKIYSTIPIDIKSKDYELPEAVAAEFQHCIDEGRAIASSSQVATARRGLGMVKLPQIVEHVKMLLESKPKVVLFLYHKEVIRQVADAFPQAVVLSGETPPHERQRAIDSFQSLDASSPKLFIGQITAAGVGITLTASDIAIFGELDWQPAAMAQAIDRLHRIGQRSVVEVQYLVAQNSMDGQIIGSLQKKITDISEVMK